MSKASESTREFAEIRCANSNVRGRPCALYLGAVEISRPNTTYMRCHNCNVVWRIDVSDGRSVTMDIPAVKLVTSKTTPVQIVRQGLTEKAGA